MIAVREQPALMTHSIFPEERLQILEEQDGENKGLLKFTDVTQIPSHDIHIQYLIIQHTLKHLGHIWISSSLSPKDTKKPRLALKQWKMQLCLKAGIVCVWTDPFPYCQDRSGLKCQQVLDTWSVISHQTILGTLRDRRSGITCKVTRTQGVAVPYLGSDWTQTGLMVCPNAVNGSDSAGRKLRGKGKLK